MQNHRLRGVLFVVGLEVPVGLAGQIYEFGFVDKAGHGPVREQIAKDLQKGSIGGIHGVLGDGY